MPDGTVLTIEQQRLCRVSGASPLVKEVIDQETSYFATGFARDWRYKTHRWDGKEHLFVDGIFPAGLAPRVLARLRDLGHQVTLRGYDAPNPQHRPVRLYWHEDPPLRPYQEDGAAAALDAGRGIVFMATATGKTVTMAALIAAIGLRTLVIVPTKELLHQTAATLAERLGIRVARFGDGQSELGDVTVALFQALAYSLEDLRAEIADFGVVISDECHHTSAATWLDLLLASPAHYRYGFTGTPHTGKGEDLLMEAMSGPVIYTYDDRQGIRDGWLTAPQIYMLNPAVEDLPEDPENPHIDFLSIYKQGIVHSTERNAAFVTNTAMLAEHWGKTLLVVKEIGHGLELAGNLGALGVKTDMISGAMPSKQRKRVMNGFAGTQTDVLVATSLLDEGVDIPTISAVVLAGAGKAQHKVAQRIGRGMRLGGREKLAVLDSWDNAHFVLQNHSRSRLQLYKAHGWPVHWV